MLLFACCKFYDFQWERAHTISFHLNTFGAFVHTHTQTPTTFSGGELARTRINFNGFSSTTKWDAALQRNNSFSKYHTQLKLNLCPRCEKKKKRGGVRSSSEIAINSIVSQNVFLFSHFFLCIVNGYCVKFG